jgi:hypothetical protein
MELTILGTEIHRLIGMVIVCFGLLSVGLVGDLPLTQWLMENDTIAPDAVSFEPQVPYGLLWVYLV